MIISIMSVSKDAGVKYDHHIISRVSKDANTVATEGTVLRSKPRSFLHDSKTLHNITFTVSTTCKIVYTKRV